MSEGSAEKADRLSTDELDAWLAGADEQDGYTDAIAPYVAAAAVLSSFDPAKIRAPDGRLAEKDAINKLIELSSPLRGQGAQNLWQLNDKPRQIALERLGSREALRKARAANSVAADDPLQKGIDLLLIPGGRPALSGLSLSDLLGLQRASRWLGKIDGIHRPSERELLGYVERERILQPMRKLLAFGFVGRADELSRLKNYVGVLAPDRMSDYFRRLFIHVRYFMDKQPPLFLHGPGGVGKSTLLAQFIIEHADPSSKYPMPFIYLDFDRASLNPRRPHTLMFEAIKQIRAQFPDVAARTDPVEAQELMTGFESVEGAKGGQYGRSERLLERISYLFDQLARVNGQPVLIVLDTFEEAQIQGDTAVKNVWLLLRQLLERVERLRIVVAGRAKLPSHYPNEPMEIKSFDQSTALRFLREKTKGVLGGPLSDQDAEAVFELIKIPQDNGAVGTVPLSLTLAARIVLREGLEVLKQTVPRRGLFGRITAEQQQGFLNTRILQHLHGNEDLERIADPGLLVRRITTEVIQKVLAGPCGINLRDRDHAQHLFDELAKEIALVDAAKEEDALWHLPAVRRTMLSALRSKTAEELVRQIHDNAVQYYETKKGDLARAEEIYHRLCRGDPIDVLKSRWRSGLETALRGAYEETEGQARLWLAGKLELEVGDGLRAQAALADWEKQAELRARSMLDSSRASEALAALRERPDRSPASSLPLLEADALLLLNRPTEARDVVLSALRCSASTGREDLAAALLIRLSTIEERQPRLRDALQAAEEAAHAARTAGDALTELGAGAAILRLRGKLGESDVPEFLVLRREVLATLQNPDLRQRLRKRPAILRELAAEFSLDIPDLVADALEIIGIDREGLGGMLVDVYAAAVRVTGGKGRLVDTLRKLVNREAGVRTAGVGRELAALVRRGETDKDLIETLGRGLSAMVERSVSQVIGSQSGGVITLTREENSICERRCCKR